MAIIDKNKMKKPFLVDNDDSTFVGIDLPFHLGNKGDGMFSTTTTTLDAVANNVKNLLYTEQGERVFQPQLGLRLRRFLFQPITTDTEMMIQQEVVSGFSHWLPFVKINNLEVKMSDSTSGNNNHTLRVKVDFSLSKDPSTLKSVQVSIGE